MADPSTLASAARNLPDNARKALSRKLTTNQIATNAVPGIASAKNNFRLHLEFRLHERAPDTFLPDSVWDAAVSGLWNDGASFIYTSTRPSPGQAPGASRISWPSATGISATSCTRSRSNSPSSAASGRRTDSTTGLTSSETTLPSTSTPCPGGPRRLLGGAARGDLQSNREKPGGGARALVSKSLGTSTELATAPRRAHGPNRQSRPSSRQFRLRRARAGCSAKPAVTAPRACGLVKSRRASTHRI